MPVTITLNDTQVARVKRGFAAAQGEGMSWKVYGALQTVCDLLKKAEIQAKEDRSRV